MALEAANAKRARMTAIRRQAREGRHGLEALLLDPPPEIARLPMIDVVRMSRSGSASRTAMERLGRMALRDDVNLMMPIGRASVRTRRWVVEHALWNFHPHTGLRVKALEPSQ